MGAGGEAKTRSAWRVMSLVVGVPVISGSLYDLGMRMPEARAAIGQAVTSAMKANFEYEARSIRGSGYVPGPPAFGFGPDPAGHDASRVPAVPEPLLDIRYDSDEAGVIFTWKAEYGEPPDVILLVPPHWR